MKITILNRINGKFFSLLDQEEIKKEYGPEKVTLKLEDFVNDRNLNLYGVGGNGGLYSLPSNVSEGLSRNFSQEYLYLDNKYEQRTIELGSTIPALLITRSRSLYDYLNSCLFEDGTVLSMIIDMRNDGGQLLGVKRVSCEESPLGDSNLSFTFKVWGDSAYSFEGEKRVSELSPVVKGTELSYDKDYDLYYDLTEIGNFVDIVNSQSVDLDVIIEFVGGDGENPFLTNLANGQVSGWNGILTDGDKVVIDSSNRTVRYNEQNDLKNLNGTFFKLSPGSNKLKFDLDSFNDANPPICRISYSERFTSV